jgi:hypothetical protein
MTTEQILGQSATIDNAQSTAPTEQISNGAVNQAPQSFDINSFFPEDVRKDPDFERYSKNLPKDLAGIAKDYYHKNKHFGKARDVIKAEVEAELNKPVEYKPEDYSYELPEGYEIEKEILDVAKNKARELGIKPELAKQFVKELFTADAQIASKLNEEHEAEKKAEYEKNKQITEGLKKEWGYEYANNVKLADTTLAKLTSPEEHNILSSLPIESQAILTKLFHKIGTRMSEGSIGGTGQPIMSAQSKIDSIMKNAEHPYHKGDGKAVKEVMDLYTEIAKEKLGG